ncbi:MAG TPA: hypothetical protein VLH79_11780 [Chthonomonadales bacterium]|nr:hypothetical protein [Chthonomonadales bacterium]
MAGRTSSARRADRCVLEGLPRVGFYDGSAAPEDNLLPSCVKSFLQYRGEDLGFRSRRGKRNPWHDLHCWLLGMSGGSFRMVVARDEWSMADGAPWSFTEDGLDPAQRALAAAGYGCEASVKPAFAAKNGMLARDRPTEAAWRRRIVESIRDLDRPVIAMGVIGPPEPCLITGYDDGGAVLLGWNAFQGMAETARGVEIEPSGYFRKRDWFRSTQGLLFIGEKQPRPPLPDLYREALANGLRILRSPSVRGRLAGQAAFSRWADQLLDDASFPANRRRLLGERFLVHHERGGVLAEARAFGSVFLRQMAEDCPEARDGLRAAAKCFDDEHDLVWAIWEFTGGMRTHDEGARRFASCSTRGRIVPLIRLARTRDADAARHLEGAIEAMDRAHWETRAASLPANPVAMVTRGNGRTMIEGVPSLAMRAGRDCTFLGALEAATAVTERPLRYVDLMGATGVAFRLRWSNPETIGGWHMSCPCAEFMEEWDDVQRGTGFLLHAEFPGVTHDDAAEDPNVRRVVGNIDAGWPVMASVAGPDIGVIVGYADAGRRLFVRTYDRPGEVVELDAKAACGSFQLLLAGTEPTPDPARVLAAALRTAVRNWRRTKTSAGYARHGMEWYYGEHALRVWADDLRDRDLEAMPEEERERFRALNHWVWVAMLDARQAAVAYLREQAPLLEGAARAALERAAEQYERVVDMLRVPLAAGEPWACDFGSAAAQWTPVMRSRQREALLEMLTIESTAIGEMARAAQVLEATPPASRRCDRDQWALLPGVPRIGYDVHLCPFTGSLHAALQYVRDPADYDFLMGVTGACFRRFWERDDGGNVDLMYLGREPIRRAAEALNRELTVVSHADRDAMVSAIKESIGRGRPVIAFGIIGPPEAGLVTGYDRGGDVLMGWSYFQDGSLPGYFQQSDWHARAAWPGDMGCVVIGDREVWPGPSKLETLRASLEWALDLTLTERRPETPRHLSGLAAYDAWAAALEVDADYPADDPETMGTRLMVHGDQCVMLEERHTAARYLRSMASEAPGAEADLMAAADLYDQAAEARAYPWGHDMGEAARTGLADPATRREIAREVRAARDAEARAAELLAKAVAAMG